MIPPYQLKPAKTPTYRERKLAGEVKEKPRKRIKPKSSKRTREAVIYDRLKREFLAEHLFCEFPNCFETHLDIHHKARRGPFFLRVDTWMAVCRPHHDQIETNPAWAKENGYLLTPEQRRAISNDLPQAATNSIE
jgi:hypothetical protein